MERIKNKFLIQVLLFIIIFPINIKAMDLYFLEQVPSARSHSLGKATLAFSDTTDVVFFNSSNIDSDNLNNIQISIANVFDDTSLYTFSWVFPFFSNFGLGIGYALASTSQIILSDSTGLITNPNASFIQEAFACAGNYNWNKNLKIGGNIKLIRKSILTKSLNGVTLDLSATYDFSENLTLAFLLANFNRPQIGLDLYSPYFITAVGLKIPDFSLNIEVDSIIYKSNPSRLNLGISYQQSILIYHLGLQSLQKLSYGIALNFDSFKFDYSLSIQDLGNQHHFTISLKL